jgi:alpha-tubulin suppressor-like RCC1 family protein
MVHAFWEALLSPENLLAAKALALRTAVRSGNCCANATDRPAATALHACNCFQTKTSTPFPAVRSLRMERHYFSCSPSDAHVGSPLNHPMSAPHLHNPLKNVRAAVAAGALGLIVLACRDTPVHPLTGIRLGGIRVDQQSATIERGFRDTLRATAVDATGDTVDVPVVWRSSNERVATFARGGILIAHDTGLTAVTASALGVTSQPIPVRVVWFGPAFVDTMTWTRPHALMPGATLETDSLSVRVLNIDSLPVPNAVVAFSVTAGSGSVSPHIDTTDAAGVASTEWTLGLAGVNVVTAVVVRSDGTPDQFVEHNEAVFSITAYHALSIEAGDAQSGQILSDLPVAPAVRLVDSLGAPRAGVPVSFTATKGGRVQNAIVSSDANGIARPGIWTLGDIPGEQRLEADVADATISLLATATGTPQHYSPAFAAAGGLSTCAREVDGSVKCWGEGSQTGTGVTTDFRTPALISVSQTFALLAGGQGHYCALTLAGEAWCWGFNAMVDTSGATANANVPTEMPTDLTFREIAPGLSHNCAIGTDDVTYCWGQNVSGQLGDGSTTTRFVPSAVSGGFAFSSITSGSSHSCALSTAGSALCWGSNQAGQLGDGTTQQRTNPTSVTGGHTFQAIGAGEFFTCGLRTDGQVYCWGALGGAPVSATPVTYADLPTFVSLTVGAQHACALTADGTAYCWGQNAGDGQGRLGDNTIANRSSPTRVETDLRFSQISAGFRHTCALTATESAIACWGQNGSLELGDNFAAFHLTPRFVVLGVIP